MAELSVNRSQVRAWGLRRKRRFTRSSATSGVPREDDGTGLPMQRAILSASVEKCLTPVGVIPAVDYCQVVVFSSTEHPGTTPVGKSCRAFTEHSRRSDLEAADSFIQVIPPGINHRQVIVSLVLLYPRGRLGA
jgi:hypothetical protein